MRLLEADRVHQRRGQLSDPVHGAEPIAKLLIERAGELVAGSRADDHQIDAFAHEERQERTLEAPGDTDEVEHGRDRHRQAGSGEQSASPASEEVARYQSEKPHG